jgi:hypothetical protein
MEALDMCESGGPGDPKKGKSVDACASWQKAGKVRPKLSMPKFKPRKKNPRDLPDDTEVAGLHMNMRDTGGTPGELRMHTKNPNTSFSDSDIAKGAALERKLAQQKEIIEKNKGKGKLFKINS